MQQLPKGSSRQPDRDETVKVPIVPWIDEKLYLVGGSHGAPARHLPDGHDPSDSVVNTDCRTHDVPNLYVCDGSVFPTSTAVNPSLTIQAIAARTAERLIK